MKLTRFLCAAISVAAAGSAANAAVIVSDNFDSYTAGESLDGVGDPYTALSGGGNLVTTASSVSAPNSVESGTADLRRSQRVFTETGNPNGTTNQIEFSFDFFDSNGALAPYRQYANLQDTTAPSGTNQLVSMGLNNNQTVANSGGNFYMARILGYTPSTTADPEGGPAESVGSSGSYFKLNDYGVGLRSTGWHNLRVVISSDDGLSTDYDFYVDGVLAEEVNNVGSAATLRSYDNVRIGSGLSSGALARFDNLSIALVPEPASLALVGLGGLALLGRRRRSL